jgi:hypothetical protein
MKIKLILKYIMNNMYIKVVNQELNCIKSEDIHKEFKPLEHDITCQICLNIVLLPISCAFCQKLFCRNCMDEWLLNNKKCPFDHIFQEAKIIFAKNILDKVKFYCPNKTLGCNKEIFYEDYFKHSQSDCQYLIYKCNGCGTKGNKNIIESHVKLCEQIEIKCEFCKASIKNKYYYSHLSLCDERLMECEPCNLKIRQKEFAKHKFNCPEKILECEYCDQKYPKKIESNHTKEVCFKEIKRIHKAYVNTLSEKLKEKDQIILDLQNQIKVDAKKTNELKPICDNCFLMTKPLNFCCSCKEKFYCSYDCMERHINVHRPSCKTLKFK